MCLSGLPIGFGCRVSRPVKTVGTSDPPLMNVSKKPNLSKGGFGNPGSGLHFGDVVLGDQLESVSAEKLFGGLVVVNPENHVGVLL